VTFSVENATLRLDGGSVSPETVTESTTVTHDVGAVFRNVSQDGDTDRFDVTVPDAVAGSNLTVDGVTVTDLSNGSEVSITSTPEIIDGSDGDGVMDTVSFAVSPDGTNTTDVTVNVSLNVSWPAVDADTPYAIRAAGDDGATGTVSPTVIGEVTVTTGTGAVDRIELSPVSNQTMTAGDTIDFDATAFDGAGNVVEDDDSQFTWDAEGGLISGAGLFDETFAGTYNVTAELDGVTSNATGVTVETTCIDRAVAGPDGEISLSEIQTAINWWAEDTAVPDTGGRTISLSKIQNLINAWAEDETASC